ncbi:MAG: penicillin-binding protein 2 [Oscillatoriales cyanobacterium]|nr:MAG: penicillin-binding protein 2 [Oscillatoriales cyanobacterium]
MSLSPASPPSPKLDQQPERTIGRRYQPLGCLVVAVLLLGGIGARLAYLQLVEGQRYRQLVAANRIRLMPTLPTRAQLLDRSGRVLVDNRPSLSAMAWPIAQSPDQWQALLPKLSRVLGRSETELKARLGQSGWRSPVLVRLARGLSPSQMTAVAELATQIRGLAIQPESERDYPYGSLAAAILGQVGEVSATEVDRLDPLLDYRSGDAIGRSGLEAALEPQLRGRSGGEQVELDRWGLPSRVLARKSTEPPSPVRLTIDLPLQQRSEALAASVEGAAIVAIDADNGAVLAMAGQNRNPADRVSPGLKAVPPGPLFQWVTTVAALESGRQPPHRRLAIDPRDRLGGLPWAEFLRADWPHRTSLGFREALTRPGQRDSESFFEQVALNLDSTSVIAWARRFGFGQRSGIELAQAEETGPSLEELWKREAVQSRWYLGEGVNFALGRSGMSATPLQMAVMAAVAANGGYRVQPHLLQDRTPRVGREFLGLQPTTVTTLRSALRLRRAPVESASQARSPLTAAAPLSWLAISSSALQDNRPVGVWAVGCAPTQNPKLTIAVFVELLPDRVWPAGLSEFTEDADDDRNLAAIDDSGLSDLARTQRLADQMLGTLVLDYLRSPVNAFN